MKNILVTGGTTFVSKYIAEYFSKNNNVFVLNRNTKKQLDNVTLIESDRHNIGDKLRDLHFDAVIDVTAYNETDIISLVDSLGSFDDYIMISSSAVYPETAKQPFDEKTNLGENIHWGDYGTNKIKAEKALSSRVPNAYILRPPYLYGKYNNLYREAFVFDRALEGKPFFVPKNGEMKLQFFDVDDLCKMIDTLLEKHPAHHVYNVGNREAVSVCDWVKMCYDAVGAELVIKCVEETFDVRQYFPFRDYEYFLNVDRQSSLLENTKPLQQGIKEAFAWYRNNKTDVNRKTYDEFIEKYLC